MESYITLDKNMVVNKTIGDVDVVWSNVKTAPFVLYGFDETELKKGNYYRVPEDVAKATSDGVMYFARESVGGRVRFSTDSNYIAIRAKFSVVGRSSHLTLISSAGFDLYEDTEFGARLVKEFRMDYNMVDNYEQIIYLPNSKMRSFTINFPVHSVVTSLEVGLKPNSKIGAPAPYKDLLPIVFYGSSIVHGTGACRPGMTYPAIVSRELNIDYKNIGFSGQARGEQVMANWLGDLDMSVFVYDYDHNCYTEEDLQNTHYSFYKTFRAKKPNVPIIMITRPDYWTSYNNFDTVNNLRDIIMDSYLKARRDGDKNVYFIDGTSFNVSPNQYDFSLDACHPNDAGYIRMAQTISTVIKFALEKSQG